MCRCKIHEWRSFFNEFLSTWTFFSCWTRWWWWTCWWTRNVNWNWSRSSSTHRNWSVKNVQLNRQRWINYHCRRTRQTEILINVKRRRRRRNCVCDEEDEEIIDACPLFSVSLSLSLACSFVALCSWQSIRVLFSSLLQSFVWMKLFQIENNSQSNDSVVKWHKKSMKNKFINDKKTMKIAWWFSSIEKVNSVLISIVVKSNYRSQWLFNTDSCIDSHL